MGIFSKQEQPTNNVKRNAFDLTHDVHGTYNFGILYPVFCREVINNSTFEIDTSFGLQFMPTVFPVQSKIDAKIDFFYVRNRVLWDKWMSFQFDTKPNLIPPYIHLSDVKKAKEFFKVGGIADHMGVPVVSYGDYGTRVFTSVSNPEFSSLIYPFQNV